MRDASEIAFHDSEHSYATHPLPPHGGWDQMLAFETRDNGLESYLTTLLSTLLVGGLVYVVLGSSLMALLAQLHLPPQRLMPGHRLCS